MFSMVSPELGRVASLRAFPLWLLHSLGEAAVGLQGLNALMSHFYESRMGSRTGQGLGLSSEDIACSQGWGLE